MGILSKIKKLEDDLSALKEEVEDFKRPLKSIGDIAVLLCENIECENCPVSIHSADRRTEHEKCNLHITCCEQLANWILEQKQI